MAECKLDDNLSSCNCTYEPCGRKGRCCECVSYHLAARELPACYFDAAAEKTYDRSVTYFVRRQTR